MMDNNILLDIKHELSRIADALEKSNKLKKKTYQFEKKINESKKK